MDRRTITKQPEMGYTGENMKTVFNIVFFPVYFLIMLPTELGLWSAYRKEKHIKENLIQFIWHRM